MAGRADPPAAGRRRQSGPLRPGSRAGLRRLPQALWGLVLEVEEAKLAWKLHLQGLVRPLKMPAKGAVTVEKVCATESPIYEASQYRGRRPDSNAHRAHVHFLSFL